MMFQQMQTDANRQSGGRGDLDHAIAQQILTAICGQSAILESVQALIQYRQLALGEELLSQVEATSALQDEATDGIQILCDGRARVLGHDAVLQRDVAVQLLEPGMTVGHDAIAGHPIAYRVVAASTVLIADVPAIALQQLCQDASFDAWLRQQIRQRQLLLFLKTQTTLRQLPGRYLLPLLPYLEDHKVAAGERLTTAIASPAHLWLRSGIVRHESGEILALGAELGYPDAVSPEWVVEQTAQFWVLPEQHWQAASAIVPQLAPTREPEGDTDESRSPVPMPRGSLLTTWLPTPPMAGGSHGQQGEIARPPSPQAINTTETPARLGVDAATDNVIAFPQPRRGLRRRSRWSHYPFVEQQSTSDCGIACLAMIAQYWGKSLPLYHLREQAQVGREGISLKNLATLADEIGLSARPVRASFARLADQSDPWIAHWQGDHYVVVYQVKQGHVLIADPAVGKQSISADEFQENWTNYALLLEPTAKLATVKAPKASLGRYINTLMPYRSLIVQVVIVSLLIQLFGLVTPLLTQIILDRVVVQKSLSSLNVFAIGLMLFSVWSVCIISVRQYLLSYLSNRLDLTLISGFIRHALTLPLKFFEARRVGDIITRVQENQKIQRFLVDKVVIAVLDFATGFVYLALMLYYSPPLTVLVLSLIPLIVLLTIAATPLLQKVSREIFKETAEQNSILVETINGVGMVKSAAVEPEMRWQWEDHLTRQMNAQFRGQKLGIRLEFLSELINAIGGTALLWYGAKLVIQGDLTIGQLIAFNMMMGYIIHPVISLTNLWDELQEVLISVERLNDVFVARPEDPAQETRLVLPHIQGHIQFDHVTFRYGDDEERNTLENLTFEVQPGETIAIVGSSGSGKTTLIKLLQGLYSPTRGRVLVDDQDIRHVATASLRSQIGVVPQECFLFSGTILENIRLYRQDMHLDDVLKAAKLAEAHAFIQALPLGYNTKVGERGSTLSGGQRQRIAIARALLGDPRILILDEATSALDTASERRFQHNLEQLSRDRTTFIIAHRLSTVRHADRILVLDQGILVEQGTHDELMQQQGLYFHLVQQQLAL